jgi:hypothetical protein
MRIAKLPAIAAPEELTPLRPRVLDTDAWLAIVVPWRLVAARRGESCRWECVDRRWVSMTLGEDHELGQVIVSDSSGRRQTCEGYEQALDLAKTWRD